MKIAITINWNLDASSLTNIARHNFRELGKIMNKTKSFTLSAIGIQSVSLGDFNQRYDILHIPNMGGYKFPTNSTDHCKKIIFGPNQKYFLNIGETNFVRKNQERLIKAFIKCKKFGLTHNLIIAGKHVLELENICNNEPGIFLLDWITNDDLLELIQGADVFVLPSIHEGFGMPLVESMACGIPCISSNIHSPPEVISDCGLLVNPYDVSDIANAMISIINEPKLLEELSEKSLKRSNDFSWKKNAQQIFKLYDIDPKKPMENFDYFYDLAAYRTLVSVCDFFPDKKQNMILSLLRFDYTDILNWAINSGLDDPMTKDFLLPFEDWIYNHQNRN
jgi:glycosyltransferase involved in cell wall biosynthesis